MMKIIDIKDVKDFEKVTFNKIGLLKLQTTADEVISEFVKMVDGVVVYNETEIKLIAAHLYLRLATDLFEDVEVSDNEVNDILLGLYDHDNFGISTGEFYFLQDLIGDKLENIQVLSNVTTVMYRDMAKVAENLNSILDNVQEKLNSFSTVETIDALANTIRKITSRFTDEDVNKLKAMAKAFAKENKNGIN